MSKSLINRVEVGQIFTGTVGEVRYPEGFMSVRLYLNGDEPLEILFAQAADDSEVTEDVVEEAQLSGNSVSVIVLDKPEFGGHVYGGLVQG